MQEPDPAVRWAPSYRAGPRRPRHQSLAGPSRRYADIARMPPSSRQRPTGKGEDGSPPDRRPPRKTEGVRVWSAHALGEIAPPIRRLSALIRSLRDPSPTSAALIPGGADPLTPGVGGIVGDRSTCFRTPNAGIRARTSVAYRQWPLGRPRPAGRPSRRPPSRTSRRAAEALLKSARGRSRVTRP